VHANVHLSGIYPRGRKQLDDPPELFGEIYVVG